MATPVFNSNQSSIFQMLHDPTLLPSPTSALRPLPIIPMFKFCKEDDWRSLLELASFKDSKKTTTSTYA